MAASCGARTGLPVGGDQTDGAGGTSNSCSLSEGVATTLATDAKEPREIALDGQNAYWADWGTVANGYGSGSIATST